MWNFSKTHNPMHQAIVTKNGDWLHAFLWSHQHPWRQPAEFPEQLNSGPRKDRLAFHYVL